MSLFCKKITKWSSNGQRGYTLLELLIVLSILSLIMGIAIPTVMSQFGKAKVKTAELQVKSLASNLEFFYLDVGRYPTNEEGLEVLVIAPDNVRGWNGPYIRQSSSLVDPWGEPYKYRLLPSGSQPFEVFSLGSDKKIGGEGEDSDVSSYQKNEIN